MSTNRSAATAATPSEAGPDGTATTTAPRARRAGRDRRRFPIGPLVVLVVAGVVWYVLSLVLFVVPEPAGTVRALIDNFSSAEFTDAVGKTAVDGLVAFVLATLAGVLLGALIGLSRFARRILEPPILALNGIPKIAIYPVLMLVFGLGSTSQVTMGFIFGVFPVIINFGGALATVPAIYGRVARSLAMPWYQRLLKLDIPAALPSLAVGLRLAFSLSLVGVVFAEIIGSKGGLGQIIIAKYTLAQYELMGAAVLLLIVTSLVGTTSLWALERRMARRWR
ncbi:ABC transporter permease [Actinophytocola sp.]|uniref:ABC transporter permease n=1 Tax=Actinophytocola sp. TaxID=1872138 RepID=UPI003D6B8B43